MVPLGVALLAIAVATAAALPSPTLRVGNVLAFRPASSPLPRVDAPAFAISYDGRLLAGRKTDAPRPTASTIKLLTALAVLREGIPLSRSIVVSQAQAAAAQAGARAGNGELPLAAGEILTVRDLLVAMLLPSADDAANMLAEASPGGSTGLLARMRSLAGRLGLTLPALEDASGLSPLDRMSPRDELRLGLAALRSPVLADIVRSPAATLSQGSTVHSLNRLLGSYPGAIGVKTGQTAPAGYVLLFAARRQGTALGVVMGEASDAARFADARLLLDWAFAWAKGHALPAGTRAGDVIWPGGARQVLRTAAGMSLASGGTPKLYLVDAADLARGGRVGFAVLDGRRVALSARPAPLWLRLWTLAASWRTALFGP